MKCELCVYSIEACHIAAQLGVPRVELCASPADGGITPSMATIEQACSIEGLDVSVMIRPRGGDFLYSDEELRLMMRDIEHARTAGATGVVFGVLTSDGRVDVERTRSLVEKAQGMQTTFHRAIDMTVDYEQAIRDVIETGCTRILTSGGEDKAVNGIERIVQAVALTRGKVEIMVGSGVNPNNAALLVATGVDALHFSAKRMVPSTMNYRNPRISMGGCNAVDEYALRSIDVKEIRAIMEIMN